MYGSMYFGQAYFGQATPDRIYWGVDSLTKADEPISGQKFFDLIKAQAEQANGTAPRFWGRYIGRQTGSNLQRSEALYLHSVNCRILLIYGGTTPGTVNKIGQEGYQNGANAAIGARDLARALHVPEERTVWIYCNIEPDWSPTVEFFRGWFETMRDSSGYGGGVYGSPGVTGFNAAYCDAWTPANPPRLLYSGWPLFTDCQMNYRQFKPARPACSPPKDIPTVIYQYSTGPVGAQGCPVTGAGAGQKVDLDLANLDGFKRMWVVVRAWEAFLAFDDGGEEVSLTYPAIVRCMDELADGRLVIVFVTQRPTGNFLRTLISSDGGFTWTAKDELNLSTPGYAFGTGKYGGVIAWGDLLMAFFRRGKSIYRRNFNPDVPAGSQWATEVAIVTETGTGTVGDIAAAPLPSRSRDRSKAGVLYFIRSDALAGRTAKWAFLDASGNVSGTIEEVDPTDSNALTAHFAYFQENNEPLYARRPGDPFSPFTDYGPPEHGGNGHVLRKIRSGSWPATLEQLESQGEPLTLVEQFSLLTPGDTVTTGQPAVYGGGQREGDGDFHSLIGPYILDNNNDYVLQSPQTGGSRDPIPPTFRWRRQDNGIWKEDTVNFASRARPITARTYKSHQMPFFITDDGFAVGMVVMATSGIDFTKQGSKAWGPFMFAVDQQVQTDVSVPNAVIGESVTSVTYDQPHGGATLSGAVTAAGTVTATFTGVRNYDPATDPPTPDVAAGTVTAKIAPHYTIWFVRRFVG